MEHTQTYRYRYISSSTLTHKTDIDCWSEVALLPIWVIFIEEHYFSYFHNRVIPFIFVFHLLIRNSVLTILPDAKLNK